MKKYLVTGAAGFIGFHLSRALLDRGDMVTGLDNMNMYYGAELKKSRLNLLMGERFNFVRGNIEDSAIVRETAAEGFDAVVHLAAQAGVRYSLINPEVYIKSNLAGFFNVIDACREQNIPRFLYASSSSVYGCNEKLPFSEDDRTDAPVSLYAATKKSNELMAHTYSYIYGLKTTGIRFFTVYGPYGRPDMALFGFTKNILEGKPIKLYNHGGLWRDFTYVDDIVSGVLALMESSEPLARVENPYSIYNLGNSCPVSLMDFVRAIEDVLGRKAIIEYLPMQPGDVKYTSADVTRVKRDTGFAPGTALADGVSRFVSWYREYYGV